MKLAVMLLILGICFPQWTIAISYAIGDYVLDIDKGTLKSVTTTVRDYSTRIDLSNMGIKHFGENVFDDLLTIREMDLSNNKIEMLPPKIFSKLHNLKVLSLANNRMSDIKGLFNELRNLTRLDLSNNSLPKLHKGDLYGLPEFTEITIGGNELESISSCVFRKPSADTPGRESEYPAYYEYLEENRMYGVPLRNDFRIKICKSNNGTLKSVEHWKKNEQLGDCIEANVDRSERILDLTNHGLINFKPGWYKLPAYAIDRIDMSINNIVEIGPEVLNDLPLGLVTIDFSFNNLNAIRKQTIKNPHIRELILNFNSIKNIDANAFKYTNIAILHAGGNELTSLNFLQSLDEIEYLYLPSNSISGIFINTLQGFPKLRVIDLSNNNLQSIEPGAFEDQKKLFELRLHNNNITELPYGIFKGFNNMRKLDLSDNGITEIYRNTFSELRNLKDLEIDFSNNKIKLIDDGSFSNHNFVQLDLSFNQINDESIANGAFRKCQVRKLSLAHNYITELDSEVFRGIFGSYELNLRGNQIGYIKKGDAEHLGGVINLILDRNPIKRLDNGALFGLSQDKDVEISVHKVPLKVIQAGFFLDV